MTVPESLSDILGVAIFDPHGLPLEYFTTPENQGTEWVQTVFQALSLKALMISSLALDEFQNITIRTADHDAIVVSLHSGYTALLLKENQQLTQNISDPAFYDWVSHFEAEILRHNDRFELA